ncbi:hypothetical protein V1478_018172 [Vespula squamosa]|uniref:Uncharacterized protein n=1 Tax=Vespula squamosa TaxID=30214 RepID=A0ABD1ZUY1_VESSQ
MNIIALIVFLKVASALIGYDCTGSSLNISTFSLLNVAYCETPDLQTVNSIVFIQLLQASDYNMSKVLQCRIEIDRTIFHCDMHSHISIVHNGRREYLHPLTQQQFQQLHVTESLLLGANAFLSELRKNNTDTRSLTLSGTISTEGTCKGSQYMMTYGTWDDKYIVETCVIIYYMVFTDGASTSHNHTQWTQHILIVSGAPVDIGAKELVDNDKLPLISEVTLGRMKKLYPYYLEELNEQLSKSQETARHNLNRVKERFKYQYDKRQEPVNFEEGDRVYRFNGTIKEKFDIQYLEPMRLYRIILMWRMY